MNAEAMRNAILGRSRSAVRKVGTIEGIGDVFVKVATVDERRDLLQLGGAKPDAKGELTIEEPDRFTALCITRLAVDENGARVWTNGDVPQVLGLSVDDPYWVLMGPAAMQALQPDAKKLEESKGN